MEIRPEIQAIINDVKTKPQSWRFEDTLTEEGAVAYKNIGGILLRIQLSAQSSIPLCYFLDFNCFSMSTYESTALCIELNRAYSIYIEPIRVKLAKEYDKRRGEHAETISTIGKILNNYEHI